MERGRRRRKRRRGMMMATSQTGGSDCPMTQWQSFKTFIECVRTHTHTHTCVRVCDHPLPVAVSPSHSLTSTKACTLQHWVAVVVTLEGDGGPTVQRQASLRRPQWTTVSSIHVRLWFDGRRRSHTHILKSKTPIESRVLRVITLDRRARLQDYTRW